MNRLIAFSLLLLGMIPVSSQVPQAFNYQAIVRDSDGVLLSGEAVEIQVRIIDAEGAEAYSEMHTATTNELGLVNLMVGEGLTTGELSSVDWSKGPYFLEITLNGDLMGSSPLLSVPYAFYAEQAGNVFSGDYNELENTPLIPSKTSELENDAAYIADETDPVFGSSVAAGITAADTLNWGNHFSGWYGDLSGTPQALHEFEADMGGQKLANIGAPEDAGDAVNLQFLMEAMIALYSPEQLWDAGLSVEDLLAAGIPVDELLAAGVPVDELYEVGIFVGELEQAGADPDALAEAGLIGTVSDIDGNAYKWVKIGQQIWMAENLRTAHLNDGTPLVYEAVNSPTPEWSGDYCWYGDDSASYESVYGKLYSKGVVNQNSSDSAYLKLCPAGWRIPSFDDWYILRSWVGGDGGKLKAVDTLWKAPNEGATNATGFTGLPGGVLGVNDMTGEYSFIARGVEGIWGISTYRGKFSDFGWWYFFILSYEDQNTSRTGDDCSIARSIRCIKNDLPIFALGSTGFDIASVTMNSVDYCYWLVHDGGASKYLYYPPSDSTSEVTDRGVCWSTSPHPTPSDWHISDGPGVYDGDGTIDGLSPGTTYYIRAYATNSLGTGYSRELNFTTHLSQ